MKKNILSLAALLIASATFVACSSDDNIINEQPTKAQTYTMTINASKGDGATTRALSIDDSGAKNVLNATWATTENIYVKKGETWASGSLQPDADGATATLKGTLSGITIAKDDVLTLQFPKSDAISYDGQVGTLEDIAANFDYATASVTVADVSATGNIIPTAATTTFANQQAIVKFTLKDKADDSNLNATQLVVNDGSTDYTVNPASPTSEIYVAIPGIASQTVTLTATVGDDTYTFEKAGITFTNGQYYEITVKMKKAAAPAATGHALSSAAVGEVVGSDGMAYAGSEYNNLPTGVNVVAKVCYVSGGHGLALAMSNEGGLVEFNVAQTSCSARNTSTPIAGGTWKLATQEEWNSMINAAGGYAALRDGFASVGGTNLSTNYGYDYWSSSTWQDWEDEWYADTFDFGNGSWDNWEWGAWNYARAVLAF